MQTFSFNELVNRTMLGDEVFVLYPEALDEIQKRNERIAELERALNSCQLVIALELKEREKFKTAAEAAHAEAAKVMALSPPF